MNAPPPSYYRDHPTVDLEFTPAEMAAIRAEIEKLNRVSYGLLSSLIQLDRLMQARLDDEQGGAGPRFKRRIPQVHKSLTCPAEARAFFDQAVAANRQGRLDSFITRYGSFERWAQSQRRESAAV